MKEETQVIALVFMGIAICTTFASAAYASTLNLEEPPLQTHIMNLTNDEMDRDLTIDPTSNFTETQTLATEGATDIDINDLPPRGVSIIIQNETVSVTKEPVTVG